MEKWGILGFFLLIILFITTIKYLNESDTKSFQEAQVIKDEYINLRTNSIRSVNGVILRKKLSENKYARGAFLVDLSDSSKYILLGGTMNFLYSERPEFMSFVQVGDSLYKPKNNDSIFIYRNNMVYYFVLNKIINEKERDITKKIPIDY